LHARAEDAAHLPAHRERYTIVLARAVASLPTLSELCLPLAKLKGFFIAMKGPDIAAEVSASKSAFAQLGGIHRETISLELPYGGGGRSLVVVEKQKPTPVIFPRKAGIPSRQPLGGKFPRA
jgi:16S rRNA (guanine527-N7)-methyltransferase